MWNRFFQFFTFLSVSLPFLSEVSNAQDFECLTKVPKAGDYSHSYSVAYNSTLVRSNNAYSNRFVEASGRHNYNLTPAGRMFLVYRGQKHFDDRTHKYEAVQGDIGYRHVRCLGGEWTLVNSAWVGAPVNRDSRKYDNYNGQAALRSGLTWKRGDENESFSATLSPALRRHFYRYEDNDGGRILEQWGFEPSVSLAYAWMDWSLSATFIDYMGWDFSGEQGNSTYYHEESIGYRVTQKWGVSLTHKSDGRVANYGGTGYDISLHSKDRSMLALGVSFTE